MKKYIWYYDYYVCDNMAKKRVSLSLDIDLVEAIDEAAGYERRSPYINRKLRELHGLEA